jgi:hypothetical protein
MVGKVRTLQIPAVAVRDDKRATSEAISTRVRLGIIEWQS